jgi:hypothetical protein
MLNTRNVLECPLSYHAGNEFTTRLELFWSALRGEIAVLYRVGFPPQQTGFLMPQ